MASSLPEYLGKIKVLELPRWHCPDCGAELCLSVDKKAKEVAIGKCCKKWPEIPLAFFLREVAILKPHVEKYPELRGALEAAGEQKIIHTKKIR